MFYKKYAFVTIAGFLLCACTSVPRDGEFSSVRDLVQQRISQNIHWYQGGPTDEETRTSLDQLIKQPLTATSAVQIALLNNQRLQAEFANLGIAQADLIKAGLLSNPILFTSIRFPKGGNGGNNVEFSLAKDFLDILLRPARKQIAATEFERTKLRVANAILDLANDVQKSYYKVSGLHQLQSVMSLASDAAQNSYQLARKFDQAGNLSELVLAQERSAAAEASAELLRTRMLAQEASNQLYRLLGISNQDITWQTDTQLPEMPASEPDSDALIQTALDQRLDLTAAKGEIDQMQTALDMTRDYRWVGSTSIGISTERDPDGSRVTGPNFTVELPVFDQHESDIARMEALLEQSRSQYAALQAEVRNDIESALTHIESARQIIALYNDELLPARDQVLKFTRQEQNYMLTDAFQLLYARQQQILSYRNYIESLTDYWVAKIDLARAMGAGLMVINDKPENLSQRKSTVQNSLLATTAVNKRGVTW